MSSYAVSAAEVDFLGFWVHDGGDCLPSFVRPMLIGAP